MSSSFFRCLILSPLLTVLVAVPAASGAAAARRARVIQSDLVPSEARQAALDLASRLSHPSEPPPLSAGLKTPFDFDRAEPDPVPAPGGQPQPAQSKGARDLIEALAPLVKPTGSFIVPGRVPILSFGRTNVKVGGKLTINFEGTDYELELVTVTSTSFTLRYKDEETTRPIKSGK